MSSAPSPAAPICSRRSPGVLVVDRAAVDRINGVDEAITLATLSAFKPVVEGEMIATVKLIPFGVEAQAARCRRRWSRASDTLRIAPYVIKKVGVVSTLLPGLAPKVIDKTLRVTAERLAPAGASIIAERRVPHDETALAAVDQGTARPRRRARASCSARPRSPTGATSFRPRSPRSAARSSISACRSIPAICLLIGSAGGVPVLGAPGCARSPVENGFDWVLMRLLAGLKVTRADLTGMGVGGLLMEIVTRPQPRTVPDTRRPTATSRRSCSPPVARPGWAAPTSCWPSSTARSCVRIVAEQALASKASEVIVVTGHQADLVEQALDGLEGEIRPQSGFRRRAGDLRQGRHFGGVRKCRRRGRLPRRHAADRSAS